MARWLKASTGVTVAIGPLVALADAAVYSTALVAGDIRIKKTDGSWAAATNAPTHEESGYYEIALTSTETNTMGELRVAVVKTGVLSYCDVFDVVHANVYDSLIAGTTYLESNPGKFSISGTALSLKNRAGTEDSTRTIGSTEGADPITSLS